MFDLKNYLSSKGRIDLKTWWVNIILVNVILLIFALLYPVIINASDNGFLHTVMSLLVFPVYILVFGANTILSIKRLHDTNKSGWYLLIGLIPLLGVIIMLNYLGFQGGIIGANKYGDDPIK